MPKYEPRAGQFGPGHGSTVGIINEENVRLTFEQAMESLKKDGMELTDMLIILVGQNGIKREVRGGMAGDPKYLLKAALHSAASFEAETKSTGAIEHEPDTQVH